MRLKLDENLGRLIAKTFREAGHDVSTVRDQGLGGIQDEALYERCRQEGRCLVSLDLDFSNVLRFPPERTAGLAVLRPAGRPTLPALNALVRQLVNALSTEPIAGHLWIVEPERIRIHESPNEKNDLPPPSLTDVSLGVTEPVGSGHLFHDRPSGSASIPALLFPRIG